jgi:hypothetical protein
MGNRDNSVGQRRATGWITGVSSPGRAGKFSPHHRVHNGSETHSAPYPNGTKGSFPGCKAAGACT